MASGRLLNKTISIDAEVAALVNEVGGLAGLFYTWMIAHLDRDGRISGNPDVLRAQVTPMLSGVTPDLVRSTLECAHRLELIAVYEAEGKDWVCYPKFRKNQKNMRYDREAASAVPDNSGVTPEWVRRPPAEEKRREEKRREENSTTCRSASQLDRSVAVKQVFDHYRTHHPRSHRKPDPKGKAWKAIKARLAEDYTVEDLCNAIDGMHKTPHNLGQNERGTKYLGLELCMRDSDQVNRFIENNENPPVGSNGANSRQGNDPPFTPEYWRKAK